MLDYWVLFFSARDTKSLSLLTIPSFCCVGKTIAILKGSLLDFSFPWVSSIQSARLLLPQERLCRNCGSENWIWTYFNVGGMMNEFWDQGLVYMHYLTASWLPFLYRDKLDVGRWGRPRCTYVIMHICGERQIKWRFSGWLFFYLKRDSWGWLHPLRCES